MSYQILVQTSIWVTVLSFVISIIIYYLFIEKKISLKLWFFSYWPFQSVSFYIVYIYCGNTDIDAYSSFIFEVGMLIIFIFMFKKIRKIINSDLNLNNVKIVKKILSIILLANISIIALRFFSEDGVSRISNIYSNPAIKYIYYTGHISMFVGVILAAYLLNRKYRFHAIMFVVIAILLMVTSASKGSAVIYILQLYSLSNIRFGTRVSAFFCCAVFAMLFYLNYLADKLSLEFGFLLKLVLVRFGLHNDTRALALYFPNSDRSFTTLAAESLRGVGKIFDLTYSYPPIGALLYSEEFGTKEVGGNGAFTGLVNYFYISNFSLLIYLPALVMIASPALFATRIRYNSEIQKLVTLSLVCNLILILNQDFLALFPSIIGLVGVLMLSILSVRLRF